MKKALAKILALTLILASAFVVLVSCGGAKIEGTYGTETGNITLEFKGNNVTYTLTKSDLFDPEAEPEKSTYEMTYKINGDKITFYCDVIAPYFTFTSTSNGTFYEWDFEMGDDYIKVGQNIYNKK